MPRAKAVTKSSKPKIASKKVVATKPVSKAVKPAGKELPKETGLKISVYGTAGKVLESLNLPKEIFGLEENKTLLAQAVRVYLANQRQGTVKTKSRGEVNISTRKIYRQKGTGRARHGAASAPIFVGGGVAFGPRQRDYSLKLSKNSRKKALFTALSFKLKNGQIKIVSGLEKIAPKTQKMAEVIEKLDNNAKKRNLLLITPQTGEAYKDVVKAARNIEGIEISSSNLLNTYEVLKAHELLFMKEAISALKETKAQ